MNHRTALLSTLPFVLIVAQAGPAMAQTAEPGAPTFRPAPAPVTVVAPVQPAPAPQVVVAAPQPQQVVVAQPQQVVMAPAFPERPANPEVGQWVQTADGYIWVPNGSNTVAVEGVPYTYLYTPAYGWTWYASPWGWGPYAYGPWVSHPWPFGYRAWGYGAGGWGWRGGVGYRGGVYGHGYGGYRGGGGAHFGGGGGHGHR